MSKKAEARAPETKYIRKFKINKAPWSQWLMVRDFTSDRFRRSVPK